MLGLKGRHNAATFVNAAHWNGSQAGTFKSLLHRTWLSRFCEFSLKRKNWGAARGSERPTSSVSATDSSSSLHLEACPLICFWTQIVCPFLHDKLDKVISSRYIYVSLAGIVRRVVLRRGRERERCTNCLAQDMRVKKRRRRYRDDAAESHTVGDSNHTTSWFVIITRFQWLTVTSTVWDAGKARFLPTAEPPSRLWGQYL